MDGEGPVPRPDVGLMDPEWAEAFEKADIVPPSAHYLPPGDDHDGRIEIWDAIGAGPDVLAHEALHHVPHHVVGREASRALDELPLELKPIEWVETEGMLLTVEAVNAAKLDRLRAELGEPLH